MKETGKRAFVATATSAMTVISGCNVISPFERSRSDDNPHSECDDKHEGFTIENNTPRDADVRVRVSTQGGEESFTGEYTVAPGAVTQVGEAVFTQTDVTYEVAVTHDGTTQRETIPGVPCDERENRFVSIVLEDLGDGDTALHVVVEQGDTP